MQHRVRNPASHSCPREVDTIWDLAAILGIKGPFVSSKEGHDSCNEGSDGTLLPGSNVPSHVTEGSEPGVSRVRRLAVYYKGGCKHIRRTGEMGYS